MNCSLAGSSVQWDSPGKNDEVGCHFLLQEIFLSKGSNLSLLRLLHWQADSLLLALSGRRKWQPTPVFLPGESQGQRSLVGCSLCRVAQNRAQLKRLSMQACIGEGNDNPLQCSCMENPRARGVGWAAIYGIAQSWTRPKRLSSSSSSTWEDEEFGQR